MFVCVFIHPFKYEEHYILLVCIQFEPAESGFSEEKFLMVKSIIKVDAITIYCFKTLLKYYFILLTC